MKRTILFALLIAVCAMSFAQGNFEKKYRSLQLVGHYQFLAEPIMYSEPQISTHPVNPEIGIGYQIELGTSPFYFDTGVYLGYFKAQMDELPDDGYNSGTLNKSSQVRLKLPIYFDYMFNVSDNLVIYPSFGLAIGLGYERWSMIEYGGSYYNDSEYGNELTLGAVFPHLGINAIINNKYFIGAGYELYLSTNLMFDVHSLFFRAGIAF